MSSVACLLMIFCIGLWQADAWNGNSDRVLLRDVNVVTMYEGRYTNARRSAAIPQLKCVGGTAGCYAFTPKVVQCYNRGSDGYDIQWECKTDMDQKYRFGELSVSCEGYDHPDDAYILKGSCGLEYQLDLTVSGGHQYYSRYGTGKFDKLLIVAIVIIVVYVGWKLYNQGQQQQGSSRSSAPPPPPGFSAPPPPGSNMPPPPGFKPEFMPNQDYAYDSHGQSSYYGSGTRRGTGGAGTGGGFWTGAATGGILGYLFGSRNNQGYQQPYYGYGYGGSGYGSSGGWYRQPSPSSSSSSFGNSGSRTVSGFGGTKRR